MYRLIIFSIIQCLFFTFGQVFLKLFIQKAPKFDFSWRYFKMILMNINLLLSGICMLVGVSIWLYVLKNFEFSKAYPMTSLSFVFGAIAGIYIFNETVGMTQWAGILLIVIGTFLILK
ncbi:hypothetical protein E0494_03115 [Marinilabiliaceae bacterium JC040]|nr:hypothetical protein [Marinilabiliaceae bacterium JC040]